jgi:hypothetical protein
MFNKFKGNLNRIICLLLATLFSFFSFSSPAIAHETPDYTLGTSIATISPGSYSTLAFLRWLFGRGTKDEDRPARTTSAGRRGKCSNVSQNFVGLVPPIEAPPELDEGEIIAISPEVKSFVGTTIRELPKLWFHIPPLPEDVKSLEFMVQDEGSIDLLDKPVTDHLTQGPGVYYLDWPVSSEGIPLVPLESNKAYHWFLSIICDSERPSRNPSIDAWIKRVESFPAITNALTNETEEGRIELSMNEGIWSDALTQMEGLPWHDALTQLATLRCQQPDDSTLSEAWESLLKSIGIADDIASSYIIHCSNDR